MIKAKDLITKARAGLILDQPFFASICMPMRIEENSGVPTMATDGYQIYYNATWVETLTLPEVTFVLAHEVMHVVFQHMCRRGDRNANKWNIATDYVINDALVADGIGRMPKMGLLDPKIVADGRGTAEGVYRLLPADAENKKPGDKGGALDDLWAPGTMPGTGKGDKDKDGTTKADAPGCFPGTRDRKPDDGLTDAELSEREGDLKRRVEQGRNAARACGKMSAGLDRLVKELIKTQTNWREVLRRFLSERTKTEYTFARPKRRFMSYDDLYLPSLRGEKLGIVAVAIDCSGSIRPAELELFASEIKAIMQDVQPSELHVIYFDHVVTNVQVFKPDDIIELKPRGGGGTAFSPIFEYLNALEEMPKACVVLTDLCCNDFGDTPEYPVLWARIGNYENEVPFGEVIDVKEGE